MKIQKKNHSTNFVIVLIRDLLVSVRSLCTQRVVLTSTMSSKAHTYTLTITSMYTLEMCASANLHPSTFSRIITYTHILCRFDLSSRAHSRIFIHTSVRAKDLRVCPNPHTSKPLPTCELIYLPKYCPIK